MGYNYSAYQAVEIKVGSHVQIMAQIQDEHDVPLSIFQKTLRLYIPKTDGTILSLVGTNYDNNLGKCLFTLTPLDTSMLGLTEKELKKSFEKKLDCEMLIISDLEATIKGTITIDDAITIVNPVLNL